MFRLVFVKALCLIFCIPVYPFVLFAEYYAAKTTLGGAFGFRKASRDYWNDVGSTLMYRKGGD